MEAFVNRIIASHAGVESVKVGEIINVHVDKIYLQDGNSPTIKKLFEKYKFSAVFDKDKIAAFFDHAVLPPNISIADRLKEAEEFCKQLSLNIFKSGEGISHILALEQGWFEPNSIVLGSDSHTCTGGVNQSLALGMGATDITAAMVSGKTWLKVPETIGIKLKGKPNKHAGAKDLVLYLMSKYTENEFLYRSIEWKGEWLSTLTLDSAATIANMTVELGGKCSFLPPRINDHGIKLNPIDTSEENYVEFIELNIDDMPPFIALPHSPSNSVPLNSCSGQYIDMVFVGSCTNSKLEDIQVVANILKGEKIASHVCFVVTPASKNIYLKALAQGLIEIIMSAGGIVTPPGCGACLGTQGPIPASGTNILSTMNRNFLGRMGNPQSNIYLASPKIAAYTGIYGVIPKLEDIKC